MSMADQRHDGLGTERMKAMSDGVFGVAMTLLLADFLTEKGVGRWWNAMPSQIGLFLSTYFILGIYWIAHNNECRYLSRTNRSVLWANLAFLAPVACMPIFLATLVAAVHPPASQGDGQTIIPLQKAE